MHGWDSDKGPDDCKGEPPFIPFDTTSGSDVGLDAQIKQGTVHHQAGASQSELCFVTKASPVANAIPWGQIQIGVPNCREFGPSAGCVGTATRLIAERGKQKWAGFWTST
ncbi:MAG: hypothetical protein Q9159_002324 [Coniocarpon cinnabarinum]